MNIYTRIGIVALVIIIVVIVFSIVRSHTPVSKPLPKPLEESLSHIYSNRSEGFSLYLPNLAVSGGSSDGYTVDESYNYQALGPNKDIKGVKFTIPASVSAGTNLSPDSYISVEKIPQTSDCTASLFVSEGSTVKAITDNGVAYFAASSNDAAAGNRYDETVYALPGTNPCIAIRYFIHYGAFENYPTGAIKQFDEQALIGQFDQIRRTLIVKQ